MFTEFLLTDGTVSIDLLAGNKTGSGISIARYTPGRIQAKDGGVWADNPMAAGRRVVHRVQGNVSDVLEIQIGHRAHNQIIQAQEELDELLEKAHDYWTTNWQSEPVWIQAQAVGETHRRYALVYGASWAEYPDPFHEPYASRRGAMAGIQLGLERSAWMNNAPGSSTALAIANSAHADQDTTGVFVGTYSSAQISHIFTRTSGGTFGSNLLSGSVPYTLFSGSVVDSSVLFGSSKPFRCLVFNIGTAMNATTSWTITWEYTSDSGGTWSDLTGYVDDETIKFSQTGTHIVYFDIPALLPGDIWAQATFNSVTAFWVRARISAISGSVTLPTQTTRHIYAPVAPYVEIDEADITGNMDALALVRSKFYSQTFALFGSTLRFVQEILVGLRSAERGSSFTSYINPKTADNPAGISIVLTNSAGHGNTAAYNSSINYEHPSGYYITYAGATSDTLDEMFRIQFDSSIVQEYFGRFRLFVRCTTGASSTMRYRVQFSGADTYRIGETKTVTAGGPQVVDLGTIEIPPTNRIGANEEVNTVELLIETLIASTYSIDVTDIVLLPVDEWAAHITGQTPTISSNYYIDIDSVGYPRQWARALVRNASTEIIIDDLDMTINQQAVVHANTTQRLWFLVIDGATVFWPVADVQVKASRRYFNLRSD